MDENSVSNTSLWTAYMRAYHSKNATNKIFDDHLAYDLVPKEVREQIEQQIIHEVFLPGTNNIVTRARYTEDIVEETIQQGVTQYVILGAGMDTFAFRRQDLMENLKVFEIDHPATQEFKFQRVTKLGWKIPENLQFIPIDFTKQDLETELTNSPNYDPKAKTLFSWLGVINYLTREEVETTLLAIANIASSGSRIVFDYMDLNAIEINKKSQQVQESKKYLEKIGEPRTTGGFYPSELGEDLSNLGFNLLENLSPSDIEKRYLRGFTDVQNALTYINFAYSVIK